MNAPNCEHLDGYLADWLSESERTAFLLHLSSCPHCRHTIHEHQRLEGLLAQALAESSPLPPSLIERIEQRLRAARRRRLAGAAIGLAVAAVLAGCATAWSLWHLRTAQPLAQVPRIEVLPVARDHTLPRAPVVRVTLAPSSRVEAVPLKSHNADVTIIWLYPSTNHSKPEGAPPPSNPTSPLNRSGL